MGIVIEEVGPHRTTGRMPVEGNTQIFGMLHGGASCVLIEGLASLAAVSEAGPDGAAFGVDINATHHRAVTSGWVHGEATALFIGGRTATYEVILHDDDGHRICTGRVTCALRRVARQSPPGDPNASEDGAQDADRAIGGKDAPTHGPRY